MTNKIIIIDLEATCWEGIPPKGEVMWIDELHGNYIFPH